MNTLEECANEITRLAAVADPTAETVRELAELDVAIRRCVWSPHAREKASHLADLAFTGACQFAEPLGLAPLSRLPRWPALTCL